MITVLWRDSLILKPISQMPALAGAMTGGSGHGQLPGVHWWLQPSVGLGSEEGRFPLKDISSNSQLYPQSCTEEEGAGF